MGSIHGEGGHCNLGPVSPQVFAFLTTHLKGAGAPVATFAPARAKNPDALTVTGDGQVSLAVGRDGRGSGASTRDAGRTGSHAGGIRGGGGHAALPRPARRARPRVGDGHAGRRVEGDDRGQDDGRRLPYRDDHVGKRRGVTLDGVVAVPDKIGAHPVIPWLDAAPIDDIAASADFARVA